MASGLRYDDERLLLDDDGTLTYLYTDLRSLALERTEITGPPGKKFLYNNYNPLLLGMILERATGRAVTDYLQEKLWDPLGMEFGGSWSLDSRAAGLEKMESGINARCVDFAKLGRLYLNQGKWEGDQIVDEEWVDLSTQDNGLIAGGPIYYGQMWWGSRCGQEGRDFFAWGNLGQFVYVSTGSRLIIVRNGEQYGLHGEGEEWAALFCRFARELKSK
jgi:CubicO group peptidase (beta-lactamase class C family)